ncbi:MAG: cell division protein ZapA [Chitinophagaceae bacterium]
MQELVAINILIADRNYRIKIEPKDEEIVRKAVKDIQDKIIEYKTQFAGKDMQDYVSMVLVWFATDRSAPSFNQSLPTDLQSKLESMENTLDAVLLGNV